MTYKEAMLGPDSKKWLGAMESKMESMHDNQVWNLRFDEVVKGFGFIKNVEENCVY
jgi:hypothetical protein